MRFFAVILFLISFSVYADQLIIEPDMGRAPVINMMNETKQSLDLVMYGFTDPELLNALIKVHDHGKSVKLILEEKPYKAEDQNLKTIAILQQNKIDMEGRGSAFKLVHQKTLIIDDKKALVMTFNFTKSSFKNERNFGLIIDDPKTVHAVAKIFSADWNGKPSRVDANNLIFSPDNSREQLSSLINHAHDTINIYAQSVKDFQLIGALARASKRGVAINILTSSNTHSKQINYLRRLGVHLKQSKKLYIHAKVLVIDNKQAVLGSINLTKPSLDQNRELSIVTTDPAVIRELSQTFARDWQGQMTYRRRDTNVTDQLLRFAKREFRHYYHIH